MRRLYSTDLSDAEWACLEEHLPSPENDGRPRVHSLREILDAVFYVVKSGCAWRLLPRDFPPSSSLRLSTPRGRSGASANPASHGRESEPRSTATSRSHRARTSPNRWAFFVVRLRGFMLASPHQFSHSLVGSEKVLRRLRLEPPRQPARLGTHPPQGCEKAWHLQRADLPVPRSPSVLAY